MTPDVALIALPSVVGVRVCFVALRPSGAWRLGAVGHHRIFAAPRHAPGAVRACGGREQSQRPKRGGCHAPGIPAPTSEMRGNGFGIPPPSASHRVAWPKRGDIPHCSPPGVPSHNDRCGKLPVKIGLHACLLRCRVRRDRRLSSNGWHCLDSYFLLSKSHAGSIWCSPSVLLDSEKNDAPKPSAQHRVLTKILRRHLRALSRLGPPIRLPWNFRHPLLPARRPALPE